MYVLFPYFFIALVLTALQRYLIYPGRSSETISARDARLPEGRVHTITMESEDGLELRGWHVLAAGRTAATREEFDRELALGRTLVLFFPGNGGNRLNRANDCRVLAELGADVFLFDYRGYGENPSSPSETRLAADARRAWNYATEVRGVAPERIVLLGESLGGGVATRLAAELSASGSPPAGLILRSTFSSLADVAAGHYPWLPVRLLLVDRFPSADRIGSVTCPLLQVHGSDDSIVPIELGRALFDVAPDVSACGIEKQFVELRGIGHNEIPGEFFEVHVRLFLAELSRTARAKPASP